MTFRTESAPPRAAKKPPREGEVIRLLGIVLFVSSSISMAAGFSSDIEKTLAAAKKGKKPLLISFYGIWCPPCNELEETVFETPTFNEKGKKFHLLKVDADATGSWSLKSKYKVGGYPTVVFANPEGGELFRVVGYRTPKEFLQIMDLVLAAKGKDTTKACESKKADDLWRCALVCAERKDTACADKAYKGLEKLLKPGSVRYEVARAYAVEHSATDDLKRDGYERLIGEFPDSPQAMLWTLDYLKLFEGGGKVQPKKELLEKVLSNYTKMLTDPRAAEAGVPATDVLQVRAIVLDKLGKKDEAKAAWKEAAVALEKLAKELPEKAPARGFTLERISCLEEAGEIDEALKLSNEYRGKFPSEFTFHFWSASLLERTKKHEEALPIAKKAYEVAYGDNKIRVATLLMKLYAASSDKDSAKKVFDDVKKDIQPSKELEVRTHRYLEKLEEAFKRVQG